VSCILGVVVGDSLSNVMLLAKMHVNCSIAVYIASHFGS